MSAGQQSSGWSVQLEKTGKIGRGGEVGGIEVETGNFVGDAMFDREPVELFENGSNVCMFWSTYIKSGFTVSEHAEVFEGGNRGELQKSR